MATEWYILIDGTEYGPETAELLRKMARSGRLSHNDLVRKDSSRDWVPAGRLKGLFDGIEEAPPTSEDHPSMPRLQETGSGCGSDGVAQPLENTTPASDTRTDSARCEVCGVSLTVWNRVVGEARCSKCDRSKGKAVDHKKECLSYFDLNPDIDESKLREPFSKTVGSLILGVVIVDAAIFIGMMIAESLAQKPTDMAASKVGAMIGYVAGAILAWILLFQNVTPVIAKRWKSVLIAETVGFLIGFGCFFLLAMSGSLGFLAGASDSVTWLVAYSFSVATGILIALPWVAATDQRRVDEVVAHFQEWKGSVR